MKIGFKTRIKISAIIVGEFPNRQAILTENKQRNARSNRHHKTNRLNLSLQNIAPKHRRINILLSALRSFSKIGYILGHQTNIYRVKKNEITSGILP